MRTDPHAGNLLVLSKLWQAGEIASPDALVSIDASLNRRYTRIPNGAALGLRQDGKTWQPQNAHEHTNMMVQRII